MDIGLFLSKLNLSQYRTLFEQNDIDIGALKLLKEDDLKELGISSMGHRKKILHEVGSQFRKKWAVVEEDNTPATSFGPDGMPPNHLILGGIGVMMAFTTFMPWLSIIAPFGMSKTVMGMEGPVGWIALAFASASATFYLYRRPLLAAVGSALTLLYGTYVLKYFLTKNTSDMMTTNVGGGLYAYIGLAGVLSLFSFVTLLTGKHDSLGLPNPPKSTMVEVAGRNNYKIRNIIIGLILVGLIVIGIIFIKYQHFLWVFI